MKVFITTAKVRYAETDASGIVYYGNYFVYFEVGRIEMFEALQLPYDKRLPIADTYCRYHASAAFGDTLEIHTGVEELRRCGFRLGHRVYRANSGQQLELLAEGYTSMVTADASGKPVEIPEAFAHAFAKLDAEAT